MNRFLIAFVCFTFISLSAHAFEVQKMQGKTITTQWDEISSERMSQDKLPVAKGEFWDKLFQCKVKFNEKNGDYTINLTDDIKNMNGRTVQIKGFMYPLSMEEKQKEILLSKRTPVCFFCPPGEPNEVLDVQFAKPETLNSDLVTVEGRFELINKKQEGLFFILKDAKVVK